MSVAEPNRVGRWIAKNSPTREQLAESRWMRPFGQRVLRSELWRFTRRSVPSGVAVGLVVGIFLMVPGIQIIGAALMCVPFRANIPIAAGMTFLSNPLTTPFFLVSAIYVGNSLGYRADIATFYALYERRAPPGEWLSWLASDAAPSLVLGLFLISIVLAAIGYLISSFGWSWWIARKWKRRRLRDSEAA